MFLSRVELDTDNRQKMSDLSSVNTYHGWVESCFPDEFENNTRSRKLWRIDIINGRKYLLLVSQTEPNLQILERYGVSDTAATKPYEPFINGLSEGQELLFRITLNPTVRKTDDDGGKYDLPHVTTQHQMNYLSERDEKNGFKLSDDFTVVDSHYAHYRAKSGRPIDLISATYQGTLTITDIEQFKSTLTEGFGRKKAYGFGMMTVIPV